MKPFTELMQQLAEQTSPEAFGSQPVCVALVGALRDLRCVQRTMAIYGPCRFLVAAGQFF